MRAARDADVRIAESVLLTARRSADAARIELDRVESASASLVDPDLLGEAHRREGPVVERLEAPVLRPRPVDGSLDVGEPLRPRQPERDRREHRRQPELGDDGAVVELRSVAGEGVDQPALRGEPQFVRVEGDDPPGPRGGDQVGQAGHLRGLVVGRLTVRADVHMGELLRQSCQHLGGVVLGQVVHDQQVVHALPHEVTDRRLDDVRLVAHHGDRPHTHMVLERGDVQAFLCRGILGEEGGIGSQAHGLGAKLRVLAGQEDAVLKGARTREEVHGGHFRHGER